MASIWEELVFLDKENGEALQRFVFDKRYSFLFACVDTNELKKKTHVNKGPPCPRRRPRRRRSQRRVKENHENVAGSNDSGQCAGGRRACRTRRRGRSGRRVRRGGVSERPPRLSDDIRTAADGICPASPANFLYDIDV